MLAHYVPILTANYLLRPHEVCPGHQLIEYAQPPARVYAVARGHQKIITYRRKDTKGAFWYADLPNKRCIPDREGVRCFRRSTPRLLRLHVGHSDGRALFIAAAEWRGMENMMSGARTGHVLTTEAPRRTQVPVNPDLSSGPVAGD